MPNFDVLFPSSPKSYAYDYIICHIRLKGIFQLFSNYYSNSDNPYSLISNDLLDSINRYYQPKGIIIPTFTYSFTDSATFDLTHTKSETGRFSEEIRLLFPSARTLEPILSVIDPLHSLPDRFFSSINLCSFGSNSIWHFLSQQNSLLLNIDLPHFVSTQLHYLEYMHSVPYRYNKQFRGIFHDSFSASHPISYEYFCRVDQNAAFNRSFIKVHSRSLNHLPLNSKTCKQFICRSTHFLI